MAKEETKKKTTKKTPAKKTTTKKAAVAKKAPVKKAPAKKTTKVAKKTPVVVQESNEYGKMIIALVLIALVLVACYCGYQYKSGNWEGVVKQTEDEKKFETEYETLNGTANEEGVAHKTVNILKDNNVKYITLEEADKMLEEGSGVIYFGFASCPWCRNLVPTLLDVAKEEELEEIYYVNLLDEEGNDLRSKYTLNNKNKPKKEKDASMEYYNILAALSEHVSQYVLYTESGEPVQVPEKRLSAPTVVAVKEGNVIGLYEATVEMDEKDGGAIKVISKNEKEEAKKAYVELFNKYLEKDDKKEE
jgi:thiol-disulfide isomerase/thioredoxin